MIICFLGGVGGSNEAMMSFNESDLLVVVGDAVLEFDWGVEGGWLGVGGGVGGSAGTDFRLVGLRFKLSHSSSTFFFASSSSCLARSSSSFVRAASSSSFNCAAFLLLLRLGASSSSASQMR